MAAAVDRDETASSWPGVITGDGAASARRGGRIVLVERGPERGDGLGIDGEDLATVETRGEAIAEGALHEADDTIRRVRALVIAASLLLAACATRGGMPVQAYDDLPVPPRWTPYSREWMKIDTPKVTAAKFIYFAETGVDATMEQARGLLVQSGWTETATECFVNPEKFPGVWADFVKGDASCRVAVIEGHHATHVDYTVARANRAL
jgi:hypothetical protein